MQNFKDVKETKKLLTLCHFGSFEEIFLIKEHRSSHPKAHSGMYLAPKRLHREAATGWKHGNIHPQKLLLYSWY